MNAYEIILKKRDKKELARPEIEYMIRSYTQGEIPDYQMASFLMAVFLNGMTFRETTDLTLIMRDSGIVVDLSDILGVKVDKHSTGGVGDKVSLMLAPLAASIGVVVPMISGRGLGHTGGTLDKLESIPGFDIALSLDQYRQTLKSIGVCMIGQTAEIAPADKKTYALRDVTGTVESIPLISASIMSKKLAEGIDALVLDVKVGNGAFMKDIERARDLARHLIAIGEGAGKSVTAVLTNMNQPLGNAIGNWLEMKEAIEVLQGRGPEDIIELTAVLTSYMIMHAKPGLTYEEAYDQCLHNLRNGKAFDKFIQLVKAHKGNLDVVNRPSEYPKARYQENIHAAQDGYINAVDSFELGMTGILIGAGRQKKEDEIDYSAGIMIYKKVPAKVQKGELLATLHTNRKAAVDAAKEKISRAFSIGNRQPDAEPLVYSVMDKSGIVKGSY